MACPVDTDDESEPAVAPGLNSGDGIFHDNSPCRFHVKATCRFQKTVRGRLSLQMKPDTLDAINSNIEAIGQPSALHDRRGAALLLADTTAVRSPCALTARRKRTASSYT
jgi:hypothetical protein